MILARIYIGDNAGGPVDYSAPFGETAADNIALPPLGPGGSRRVAVRFYDSETGLEEINTDASILLSVSISGLDTSVVPAAPAGMEVRETGPGLALVTWQYNYRQGDNIPEYWNIYATPGNTVDYSTPEGSEPYNADVVRYSYPLSPFPPGAPVAVSVRAGIGAALSPNLAVHIWIPTATPGAATRPEASVVDIET